uniref:Immunoglobulin domain-containing protein n=1 Tax=Cyprinus carpio TaxID=7962 RepID=A0A8C1VQ66_CYPCA
MKLSFHLFALMLFFLDNGVSGVGSDAVSVSMMEGDSVIFHTGVETNQQEDIKWYFIDTRIAQISGDLSLICTDVQCNDGTERFRDRLKLDHQTGSLTIMNITNTDSGVYELKIISSRSSSDKIFNVTVSGVSEAERDEMKRKSVKEGESVTLESEKTKSPNDVMTWYFNETKITGDQRTICTDDQCKERFRDRLKLDNQTGSLTITDSRTTDSGLYKLQITISDSSCSITIMKRFSVTVIAVPGSGLSSAAVAGIVIVVLLVAVAVAAGVFYCHRRSHTAVPQNDEDVNPHSGIQKSFDGHRTSLNQTQAEAANKTKSVCCWFR